MAEQRATLLAATSISRYTSFMREIARRDLQAPLPTAYAKW
jgi:hypothetical protein